ncbi:MAG: restriction endonuclease subunit S [Bacteroidales bacterium]|nr:restriction endonuclease subunit S [Bacteroidales bacterium]
MKTACVTSGAVKASANRIDASFHLSDGMSVRRMIKKSPWKLRTIGDVTSDVYCPGIFHRNYVVKGTPFLGGGDILKQEYDSGKYLVERTTPNHPILKIKRGWTLVTCGGTIGETAFVNSELAKCWVSQHVMRVIPKTTMPEGMLYAYLASKYGKMLLTTNTYGSVIPTLNAASIQGLPIPDFPEEFQAEVDGLVQRSATLREQAASLLAQAVQHFDRLIPEAAALRLGKIPSRQIVQGFVRFDAQYQLGSQTHTGMMAHLKTEKIGDFASRIFIGNRDKRAYVDHDGVPFLSSSDMLLANPLHDCKQTSRKARNLELLQVNYRDILISRSGTIGNTVIVGQTLAGVAVSEHALRLRIDPEKIEPEYVFAFLKSTAGQHALAYLSYGSVIITLGEMYVADIELPILPEQDHKEIVTAIRNYMSSTDEAKECERRAISLVEAEIEKWDK